MNLEVEPHASHTVYFHCLFCNSALKGNRITSQHQARCDWNTPPHHTEPLGPTHARMLTGFVLILVRRLLFHSGIWPPRWVKGQHTASDGVCQNQPSTLSILWNLMLFAAPVQDISASSILFLCSSMCAALVYQVECAATFCWPPPPPPYMYAQHE